MGKMQWTELVAQVKRQVWMQTLSRAAVVNSLQDFCTVAERKTKKIEIESFFLKEIQTTVNELHLHDTFSSSTSIIGIKKKHFVTVLSCSKLLCKDYSN